MSALSRAETAQLVQLGVVRAGEAADYWLRRDAEDWAWLAARYWTLGEIPTRSALFARWYADPTR